MSYLAFIAVFCAYIVKGLCGFANTLVFGTIMSFQTNNINISPVELIVGYPANIIIALREKRSISAKVCVPLSILVILGSIPGAIFLKNGNTQVIKVIFGIVVMLVGIEMFLRERQSKKRETSPIILTMIGIISGILCGLFGVGALLAAYVSRTTQNSSEFRGNISVVFIVENTFRIILYLVTGILKMSLVKTAVILMPFMLLGLVVGILLSKKIQEKVAKKAVVIMLIISGCSLILQNIV
jgi:uncharacterized membrane protein YfcA